MQINVAIEPRKDNEQLVQRLTIVVEPCRPMAIDTDFTERLKDELIRPWVEAEIAGTAELGE